MIALPYEFLLLLLLSLALFTLRSRLLLLPFETDLDLLLVRLVRLHDRLLDECDTLSWLDDVNTTRSSFSWFTTISSRSKIGRWPSPEIWLFQQKQKTLKRKILKQPQMHANNFYILKKKVFVDVAACSSGFSLLFSVFWFFL